MLRQAKTITCRARSLIRPLSILSSSQEAPFGGPSPLLNHRSQDIPHDFLRWVSLGSSRGLSRFASGFTPLKPKPLDSIIDVERVMTRSPEELVSIWDDMPHMLFTGLEDYKARGTQASPYLTVTYYKEFAETKDVVLVRGDIVFASKLDDEEAKWLIQTAQSFYLNDTRYNLVEQFNKMTHDFEFKDVLQALDMPTG
ncbi:hypothetical protein QJS04_geneDACA010971 [Acorus gramineus]|uniref:ATP synthase mitochondrial F1 complex assembly factor 1 n=1 Tax=Acorus gramineus TaxID=55184 RepID=A0AAV9BDW2_ACOGR|nr:hypothetical protein QJS04_geneDACA010971 [Acorus gramineus]